MARCTILRLFLAALAGCGGQGESAPTSTVLIDISSVRADDDVAQAAAAEHGAPGEGEQRRYVLVGDGASEGLVAALRERGFADVSLGSR